MAKELLEGHFSLVENDEDEQYTVYVESDLRTHWGFGPNIVEAIYDLAENIAWEGQ